MFAPLIAEPPARAIECHSRGVCATRGDGGRTTDDRVRSGDASPPHPAESQVEPRRSSMERLGRARGRSPGLPDRPPSGPSQALRSVDLPNFVPGHSGGGRAGFAPASLLDRVHEPGRVTGPSGRVTRPERDLQRLVARAARAVSRLRPPSLERAALRFVPIAPKPGFFRAFPCDLRVRAAGRSVRRDSRLQCAAKSRTLPPRPRNAPKWLSPLKMSRR
jgi:hypothetical protein